MKQAPMDTESLLSDPRQLRRYDARFLLVGTALIAGGVLLRLILGPLPYGLAWAIFGPSGLCFGISSFLSLARYMAERDARREK